MNIESVIEVEHLNDKLFRFTTTKHADYKFIPGQFTMIGLPSLGSDLMRAYSIASPATAPYLEFYSIKVPDGEFTNPLSQIEVGDQIEVADRPVGSLMIRCLKPGKRLWLLSTGTGIAPFMSIIRDEETFRRFDKVILTHTVRQEDELAYQQEIQKIDNLFYYPTVTRQENTRYAKGRITEHINNGLLFNASGIDSWAPDADRAMICGSTAFVKDMEMYFKDQNWQLGSLRSPGDFLIERAFVTR